MSAPLRNARREPEQTLLGFKACLIKLRAIPFLSRFVRELSTVAKKKSTSFLDIDLLIKMCSFVRIPSKEGGDEEDDEGNAAFDIHMDPLLPTQLYVLQKISEGLKAGKNIFYIVKCRQSGITTLGHVILHFLRVYHKSLLSSFIADNAQRLWINRRLATKIVASLSKHPEWSQEIEKDNRYELSFRNDSVTFWLNANSDDEGGLGRSMGMPVNWGTEMGGWHDEVGTNSLLSSLPEHNPRSLNVFEGTATGPNLFKEKYDNAKNAVNQMAIFVPWWMHPWYEVSQSDPQFAYWTECPRYTREEAQFVEAAAHQYNFQIRPTQLAWFRSHLRQKKGGNLQLMLQEYPSTEEDAWIYGGSMFVDGRKLRDQKSKAVAKRSDPRRYFIWDPGDGVHFMNSDLVEIDPLRQHFDLVCYAEPVVGPRVRYVIGCDPAHGANEHSDHACIHVLLCYSDKAIQVAEFHRRNISTNEIAWVILHLAGAYTSGEAEVKVNIEMQGGGTEVYGEINRLQNEMAFGYTPKLARYFQRLTHYVYTQGDKSVAHSNTVHWETSWKSKPRMLHAFKNLLEKQMLEIQSEELLDNISRIDLLRDGDIQLPAQDHRIMAMAIAGMAYIQVLDTDIGGLPEYSSTALQAVHNQTFEQLTPSQILQGAVTDWKHRINQEILEERAGIEQVPDWINPMHAEVANDYYANTGEYSEDQW